MFDSVQLRLTLWYIAVLGTVLILFSTGAYIYMAQNLYTRVDVTLRSALEAVTSSLRGRSATHEDILEALAELHFSNVAVAVLDAQRRLVGERPAMGNVRVRLPQSGLSVPDTVSFYSLPEQTEESDDSCRGAVERVRLVGSEAPYTVVVNQSLQRVSEQLDFLQDIFFITVPLTLALAGVGGWLLAGRSLAPVLQMSESARHISTANLDQRLPIGHPRDEFGRLAATFNELLERLSNSFARQKQFMADASHELRTPISVIRTTAAVTLQSKDRDQVEYQDALTIIEQQARRLTRLVEDMFVLARADAGHPTLQITQFYLDELLLETMRAATVLASQRNVQLEVPALREMPFCGDEGLLRQMTWNLLDNAIKYTASGGTVRMAVERSDHEYSIAVSDTGTGIPPEAQAHVFERFFRADNTRSRAQTGDEDGAGLGLPIARWIAEAHRGHIELHHSDETGTTFVVTLPCS